LETEIPEEEFVHAPGRMSGDAGDEDAKVGFRIEVIQPE
jgi:hypothetical protein